MVPTTELLLVAPHQVLWGQEPLTGARKARVWERGSETPRRHPDSNLGGSGCSPSDRLPLPPAPLGLPECVPTKDHSGGPSGLLGLTLPSEPLGRGPSSPSPSLPPPHSNPWPDRAPGHHTAASPPASEPQEDTANLKLLKLGFKSTPPTSKGHWGEGISRAPRCGCGCEPASCGHWLRAQPQPWASSMQESAGSRAP